MLLVVIRNKCSCMSDLLEEREMRADASQDSFVAVCHLPARKHKAEQRSNDSEERPYLIEFLSEAREKLRHQTQPPGGLKP